MKINQTQPNPKQPISKQPTSKQQWSVLLYAVLAFVLVACGAAEIQPLTFEPAVWRGGEMSEYRITDANGELAGTLRYDINQGSAGDEWQIRRTVAGGALQDVAAVTVRGTGFRPQSAQLVRMDNQGEEQVLTTYDGSRAELTLTTRQDVTTYERVSITSDVRDEATLVMLMRALPLREDYATRLNVFTPILGTMERMTISVNGQETVETPAGTYDAWHVTLEGRDPDRSIEVWVAVEPPHPVVKFIDGRNRGIFELTGFQPGEN